VACLAPLGFLSPMIPLEKLSGINGTGLLRATALSVTQQTMSERKTMENHPHKLDHFMIQYLEQSSSVSFMLAAQCKYRQKTNMTFKYTK